MPHGIAVSNGTVALELALRALGIGAGDEVILPSRSFFASAACIVAVGATPVFADIDPVSNNIDPASVRRMLSPRSRAIICVHLARSEEHTSELQSIMLISYAGFCLKNKT